MEDKDLQLLKDLNKELALIHGYSSFDAYFNKQFDIHNLRGLKLKFFKKIAKDFYNYACHNCVITTTKFQDLKNLISSGSISYMGKYGSWNCVKVYEFVV